MRVLLIGGNGFMGRFVVRQLKGLDHEVAVFHRGSRPFVEAMEIIGDRNRLPEYVADFREFAPDVVVDLVLSSARQAEQLIATFRGIAKRLVAISSMDVYRAAGILHGTEPGPLQEVPLSEESELRTNFNVYPPAAVKMLQSVFTWLDEEYDKVLVERALRKDAGMPLTVLRLPMVYGPGDPLHRLYPLIKRMQDGRHVILMEERLAGWRGPRGYVEDVAHAIVLAVTSRAAADRTYNIAMQRAFSELEWAQEVAKAYGWSGRFVLLPKEKMPSHLLQPGNADQHWSASSERIRRELGYAESLPFEESLMRTIDWELENVPPQFDPKQFDYVAEDEAAKSGRV
jgi:nucleoside-diphosphate-sugar epimerase